MIVELKVKTENQFEMVDLTAKLRDLVKDVKEGIVTLYTPHSTAAIVVNENYDANIPKDIFKCLGCLIPEGGWLHDEVDKNATAHIKAAILGPSESIPIENGKLLLGTWQSPMLVDFDGPKERKVIVHIH
ncbi:MAG: secondary thiamine-phosphate synthase enzyme YjbQ [archaeon]